MPARGPATIPEILRHRAEQQPDALAYGFLTDGAAFRDRWTYAELDRRAGHVARQLRSLGVGDEPVLLLYPPGLDYVAAFFGCLYAGAIAVPAYPPHRNRSLDRLRSVVRDSRARTVLSTRDVAATVERSFAEVSDLGSLRWLTTDELVSRGIEDSAPATLSPDSVAFLQYTSGSTRDPRGVVIAHRNLMHNAAAISQGFEPDADSVTLFWLPLYHDMGLIGGILQPLYIGCPSLLMSPVSFLTNPIRWLRAISEHRATISGAPNFAYDLCVTRTTPEQRAGLDLSCWQVAFNGAEPVRADTLERFTEAFAPHGFRPEAFYPCYGLAEATLIVTGGRRAARPVTLAVDQAALERHRVVPANGSSRRGSRDSSLAKPLPESRDPKPETPLVGFGTPLLDQEVVIADPEARTPCPPDRPGEIWVRGANVAQGYWRRDEETAATFGAHLADGTGPFLRTGDLGFRRDGELFVTGRSKDLIILRGRNHYPQDIEQTAERSHPALRPAAGAAFSVPSPDGDERLVVVQELERQARKTPVPEVVAAIRQAVAERHDLPVEAVVLLLPGSIPKTSSGKVQRHACRTAFLDGTLKAVGSWTRPPEEPATAEPAALPRSSAADIEAWLAARIARTLRVPPDDLDVRQPLARYGLDSLTAVQLAADLGAWLGRDISPVLIYDYPTIDALARHLAGGPDSAMRDSMPDTRNPKPDSQPIAVIGIGCRFPGADGPTAFWKLLTSGTDAIGEVPPDRWDADAYYNADASKPGTMNTRWGGFLRDVDRFDRQFFGISPREAARMDPQQRLLLETTWEALADAGQDVDRLAGGSVGVFVGISGSDYGRLQAGDPRDLDAYVGTGNALSIAANRLSYAFDFRGPSLAVDTACSSSLVAVHLAMQSLRRGESSLALAAGVNLLLDPGLTINFTRAGMMAPDGRCKAFDAKADGYVRGEGVGVVVLKLLAQAVADGDPVYATIRGSAVTQDGRSNGLTAPNRQAQESVLRAAYRDGAVALGEVDYIEAHGTGTALGDPIEALALGHVLGEGRPTDRPCALGSVKTNFGHLEAAAGIAGLIKTALALKHRMLPPSLHIHEPNPHIPFAKLPLRVQTEPAAWPKYGRLGLAGVSSFGFGGTNAHVVLEAFAADLAPAVLVDGPLLVPLSARSPEALAALARAWHDRITSDADVSLADLARGAAVRSSHHDHRLGVVAGSHPELVEKLAAFGRGEPRAGLASGRRLPGRAARLVFVFSGQGPQWWAMGRQLLEREPAFRSAIEECDRAFRAVADWSLFDEFTADEPRSRLDETGRAQPVLFALQVGLAALWRSWGVEAAAVVGHSLGEIAAVYVSGALSLDDAVRVVELRGRLQQRMSGRGRMAAVGLSAEESERALEGFAGRVVIAAVNGPRSTVWSGNPHALEAAVAPLRARDVFVRLLRGQVAFHSPQMDPLREELVRGLAGLRPDPTAVPFVSTVTGQALDGPALDADYWGRNLREPVCFADAARSLIDAGHDLFLELGPHPILAEPIHQCLRERGRPGEVLPSLRRGEEERTALLGSLGALYARGFAVAWEQLYPTGGRFVTLPAYPWQRERCWFTPAARLSPVALASGPEPSTGDPDATLAAYYALYHAGRLDSGERVMICGDNDPLANTVQQLACRAGAEVTLMEERSSGIADLIVLTRADYAAGAVERLAPGGRLIDLSRSDETCPPPRLAPNQTYCSVDVQRLRQDRPALADKLARAAERLLAEPTPPPAAGLPPLLAGLFPEAATPAAPSDGPHLHREEVLALSPDERAGRIEAHLRDQTARVLRLPADTLDVEQPLNALGLDSLMAVEIMNRLEADLGVTVPMVKFLEGPSVRDLAWYLADQFSSPAGAAERNGYHKANGASSSNGAGTNGTGTGALDHLSDAEVDALLRDLLTAERKD